MTAEGQKPLRIFCSYSRKDEEYLNDLRDWLRVLERQGLVEWWYDREIVPGREYEKEIDNHLRNADIILLLVSPAYMASNYVHGRAIDRAVERHERGEARVIPVILRLVDWRDAPFANIAALPSEGKPITTWSNRDEAWLDVIRGIRKAANERLGIKPSRRSPTSPKPADDAEQEVGQTVAGDGIVAVTLGRVQVPAGPTAPQQPDVLSPETIFISYDRDEWEEFVQPLVIDLRKRGFKVWIDQLSIRRGANWSDAIQEALDSCERMVLCVSPSSMQSTQAKNEYRYFLSMNKTVIPLVLCEARTPYDLASIQFVPYEDREVLIQALRE